jgi:hypothetical protein
MRAVRPGSSLTPPTSHDSGPAVKRLSSMILGAIRGHKSHCKARHNCVSSIQGPRPKSPNDHSHLHPASFAVVPAIVAAIRFAW